MTYTTLGNTAGQSQRLRITVGFASSGHNCPGCSSFSVSHDIFSPLDIRLKAYDRNCVGIPAVILEVEVTNDRGEGDFARTETTNRTGRQFSYTAGR